METTQDSIKLTYIEVNHNGKAVINFEWYDFEGDDFLRILVNEKSFAVVKVLDYNFFDGKHKIVSREEGRKIWEALTTSGWQLYCEG